ncbi:MULTISPECIES: outer membrane beta-barrel protein [unclassified Mesorhizobium]|uniref:outer membrane protein n=1 Tax=unclassified Mesorhizobium TaxID=325217 RepID=UPI000F752A67|nr:MULTISPECIES: outer membrane beta-barrel protein [unclassified Mesorhizobium]AZO21233.1 porin family protein [Mesorhizobium sp. M1E.F.Ca.ET.045.02.1.1]RUW31158.1 P44/Msp2 family outer membrane protein [Mesorhizobium sp. M1E.F.Ca.ET.041.01.1.1]RUW81248.1 P44/Msp2 family outer membrane protein [Mesorhizobium sp. M1E.F.Ca.ET.063.01.1.1]RWB54220.1 MAG: P44/Msp2 family outer membrane protein [Mesorhizobium sp.]RWD82321.1 MAG: P44/Msp2 family outer membrane protein [Mesorhizobium sp.]
MTSKSRIALALAAIVLMPATQALSADYDPPIYVDQAPDYQPVEVGSGWYLRGDVGYAFSHPFEHQISASGSTSFTNDSSLFTGSIGMGYHLNDFLRVELNGGILPTNKFGDHALVPNGCAGHTNNLVIVGGTAIIQSVAATEDCEATNRATNKGYSVMANGYVDLGTYVGLTPYIGGGVGIAYNKYFKTQGERKCVEVDPDSSGAGGFTCDDPAGYGGSEDSEAKFNLAYSIGAGLSYQVSKNLSVDLGYEYFSIPSGKYVAYDNGAFNVHKGIDYQTVKLGLRYDLW